MAVPSSTVQPETEETVTETPWEGPLGLEGVVTSDRRMLLSGEIDQRALPLPLNVQLQTDEGHDSAVNAGRINTITHIPLAEFDRADEFNLTDLPDTAVVIWGEGVFDGSPQAEEAQRMMRNGAGVSLDVPPTRHAALDPETLQEIPEDELALEDLLAGKFVTGFAGRIAGATIVTIPAFEHALIRVSEGEAIIASGLVFGEQAGASDVVILAAGDAFVASAGLTIPLNPPAAWFKDPELSGPTQMIYTKEGRIYGHLALWDSCHIGYTGMCVGPFDSPTNFSFFNIGIIDTADGPVRCGKLMFSMDGGTHASTDKRVGAAEASKHYDNSSKVGGYVAAGRDQFGIWLAGIQRVGLTEAELAHLKAHNPSGDWRPINGASELIAAFSVPVPGFPIPHADVGMVASGAEVEALTVVLGPWTTDSEQMAVSLGRKKAMLRRRRMYSLDGFRDVSTKERKRLAKTGAAMPDGSFPIANCSDAANARRAVGRAPESKRESVRRHIARREKALGCGSD